METTEAAGKHIAIDWSAARIACQTTGGEIGPTFIAATAQITLAVGWDEKIAGTKYTWTICLFLSALFYIYVYMSVDVTEIYRNK